MVWLLGFSPLHFHQLVCLKGCTPINVWLVSKNVIPVEDYKVFGTMISGHFLLDLPNFVSTVYRCTVIQTSYIFMHSFIHAFVAHIPFIHVCIFTMCLISFVPHERVIPNVSDQKVLTNQVVYKWQVPPVIILPNISPISFRTLSWMPFVKVYHIRLYPFKGNRHVSPRIFSCIFVGYYSKGNRQDLFSCTFAGYHFKGDRKSVV